MVETKEAEHNMAVVNHTAKFLYDFLAEVVEETGIGKIRIKFDELEKEQLAYLTVRARLIINHITKEWQ